MRRDTRPREPGRWRPQYTTRAYRQLRRRILDAQGWRCAECRRAGRLELHHVNGDRESNLRGLCRPFLGPPPQGEAHHLGQVLVLPEQHVIRIRGAKADGAVTRAVAPPVSSSTCASPPIGLMLAVR